MEKDTVIYGQIYNSLFGQVFWKQSIRKRKFGIKQVDKGQIITRKRFGEADLSIV